MNKNAMLTGKPSIDRPWMKFYPDVLRGIQVPAAPWTCLSVRAADPNVIAMHYYGVDITWATVFRKVERHRRSAGAWHRAGDQIPCSCVLCRNSFICCWQPAHQGASLLCRGQHPGRKH